MLATSVLQTGVKSAGWLKSIPHLPPRYSWKDSMRPRLLSAEKSGTRSPKRRQGPALTEGEGRTEVPLKNESNLYLLFGCSI